MGEIDDLVDFILGAAEVAFDGSGEYSNEKPKEKIREDQELPRIKTDGIKGVKNAPVISLKGVRKELNDGSARDKNIDKIITECYAYEKELKKESNPRNGKERGASPVISLTGVRYRGKQSESVPKPIVIAKPKEEIKVVKEETLKPVEKVNVEIKPSVIEKDKVEIKPSVESTMNLKPKNEEVILNPTVEIKEENIKVEELKEKVQDKNSYDERGFNYLGYHKNGTRRDNDGFDIEGYSIFGYDRDGFDRNGYNRLGYNKEGFDKDGYDKNGYNKDGIDRYGRTR